MSSIFSPKIPSPPPVVMPEVSDVPSAEDEARAAQEAEDARARNRKRKGRRSTILTEPDMANVADENISKKTLLGG